MPQASAWNALFGITRCALSEVPKIPSAQPARWSSPGRRSYSTQGIQLDVRGSLAEQALELAAADDAEAKLGRGAGRGEDRLEAVQRDQLADEERSERLLGRPAGPEEPLLRADEADLDALGREAGELGEMVGVGTRVGDDEVGGCAAHAGRSLASARAGQ